MFGATPKDAALKAAALRLNLRLPVNVAAARHTPPGSVKRRKLDCMSAAKLILLGG